MRLADILLNEASGDLKRVRDMFVDRWKKVMGAKGRQAKVNDVEKLAKDLLNQSEIKYLVLKLQKNK
jgi:hypothetical protein